MQIRSITTGGILCALVFVCSVRPAAAQSRPELRAVKLTNVDSRVLSSNESIAEAMEYLASIGVNAVLPVVWNGGWTLYRSATMDSLFGVPVHPQMAGRDPLERVIIEAHRVGIEVYPWLEYGFAAWYSGKNQATGGHLLGRFPQWASRTRDGAIAKKEGFDWISAIHPNAQAFFERLIDEVLSRYDVDGIEFSDRIPAMPVEGGYDSATVAAYREDHRGSVPPADCNNPEWMQWRADRMSRWYAAVRQKIKGKNPRLFVASSPLIQPAGYDDYLLDTKRWVSNGIVDHYIPQLYVRTIEEYRRQLGKALQPIDSVSRSTFYAGILMNIGTGSSAYLISPDYLLKAIRANRDAGVQGEAFFYYEGLRKNHNQLGDTLRATVYSQHAEIPGRNEFQRRPKGIVVEADDPGVVKCGDWSSTSIAGKISVLTSAADGSAKSVDYSVSIPTSGLYGVFVCRTPDMRAAQYVEYKVFSAKDSISKVIDQSNNTVAGWQKIATVSLSAGTQRILRIEAGKKESGRFVFADAVMVMINRRNPADVSGVLR
ncbi:MAG: family 10 glycosylhydrolase [Ignavibacteriales bacterium]|nr:family 10 glycosylhydrolase [Ignavibacteriales bacterium]